MTDLTGYRTSYTGIFTTAFGTAGPITAITIPQIQRDYAQGRRSADVSKVRADYLGQLAAAVRGEIPGGLDLDFVYGTIDDGVLSPLDGQQRLTSLFLLHWLSAVRAGEDPATMAWARFSYATRDSARLFTERLVKHSPAGVDLATKPISAWIQDQPWALFQWQHDPTVQSMLVVLDDLERELADTDPGVVWRRLVSDPPVIRFHVLPLPGPGSGEQQRVINGEQLYIKMNSRGKPLTTFENFKAVFEKALGEVPTPDGEEPVAKRFARCVDGPWSDVLFPYRGADDVIDDEFLRYLTFVIEVCEWREGRVRPSADDGVVRLERRARSIFVDSVESRRNRDFLFFAFNTWRDQSPVSFFTSIFSATGGDEDDAVKIRLFTQSANIDLFDRACRSYGEGGNNRRFSLADTLMLYALLIHRRDETPDVMTRIRQLRNLFIDADQNVRTDRMPTLVREVEDFVHTGDLGNLRGLTQFRRDDESRKQRLLEVHPETADALTRLENHPLLQGCLLSFHLDPVLMRGRAEKFLAAFESSNWPLLTGALLAHGEYQRKTRWGPDYFGSPTSAEAWRTVLSYGGRDAQTETRAALMTMLDALPEAPGDSIRETLQAMIDDFVETCRKNSRYPWRYYLLAYPSLREGDSGRFDREDHSMYQAVALRRKQLNSKYRDMFIHAAKEASGTLADDGWWFTGYVNKPRWLVLDDVRVRARDCGLEVEALEGHEDVPGLLPLAGRGECPAPTAGAAGVPIAGIDTNGEWVDTEDRVQKFAAFIRAHTSGACR